MKKSIGDNMIPKDWTFERGLELVKKAGVRRHRTVAREVPGFQMSNCFARWQSLTHPQISDPHARVSQPIQCNTQKCSRLADRMPASGAQRWRVLGRATLSPCPRPFANVSS
jgi:hypothetical protein